MENSKQHVSFYTLSRPLRSSSTVQSTCTQTDSQPVDATFVPGIGSAASIASALEELKTRLPHVHLPRFPPVVRRLQEAVSGDLPCEQENGKKRRRRADKHTLATRDVVKEEDVLVLETTGGRKRVYKAAVKRSFLPRKDPEEQDCNHGSFEMVQDHQPPHIAFARLCASFLIPQGYPESVSPQYREYMGWRGVQYFFGGALSLFTTKALLTSVGIKRGAGTSAAAINWVVKDGAGRLGRFLFARWGHQLDCELKQFRLLGDLLMETGAILELCTIAAPRQFLLFACTANLLKNIAAVAASSTRAPIYRSFALNNNMADVTAKGESVANFADICGVAFGIALSQRKWSIATTFTFLSLGYLIASRKEVDSVVLPFMNQARLAYSMDIFLKEGRVPNVAEGNKSEPLMPLGKYWNGYGQVVLGASVEVACEDPEHLLESMGAFGASSPYYLSYRPDVDKVFVMLHEGADNVVALEAAFLAHLWLHRIHVLAPLHSNGRCIPALPCRPGACSWNPELEHSLSHVKAHRRESWGRFRDEATAHGWKIKSTMLAIGNTRLLHAV